MSENEEVNVRNIDDKTMKSLLKCCNSPSHPQGQRKIKENFRFTLLKLLNNDKEKTKIENAYRNRNQWAENSIQNIALNSLQDLFFNVVDMYKEQPNHDKENYYLKEKILQTIMTSYFEDKKELENEIDELQEKLDGKDMVSQEQYDSKVKQLNDQIKIQANQIEKYEQKLKEKEDYYKLKITATEKRMRAKLEMENKIIDSQKQIIEY